MQQNYSFYLFTKLFDCYHTIDAPYDRLFEELQEAYYMYCNSDFNNGNKPEYECMCDYLAQYVTTTEIYSY
jgi:hypothetical protein